MSDTTASRLPRAGGAENGFGEAASLAGGAANGNGNGGTKRSLSGLFRTWLRASLKGKSDASWRDTIEDLIEEQTDSDADMAVGSHEREMLVNILRLQDLTAYDVMVPRADIVAVEVETPPTDVLRVLAKSGHSRLPVYRDSLDDVVGMVHIKDVIGRLAEGQSLKLEEAMREVMIVAPSMRVLDLLVEMREKRQQLALVIDEFGGIDGLITIEDLVEEIVGKIEDEHDAAQAPQLIERGDGSFLADARLPIEEFEERFGAVISDEEREDIDTLGGLVFSMTGRVPARGEILRHSAGLEFEVTDADPRRIRRLKVRQVDPDAEASVGG